MEVMNSFSKWKTLTIEALDSVETMADCDKTRKLINETDLKQFEDDGEAFEHKTYILDILTKKQKSIKDKEEYNREQMEDIAAMQSVLDSIGIDTIEKIKNHEQVELPDTIESNDYSSFLTFASQMIFPKCPKYKSADFRIAHEEIMTIVSTIVNVYVERLKQLN